MDNYFVSVFQVLKLIEYCSYQERFDYSLFEYENLKISDRELKIILTNLLDENLIKGISMSPNSIGFKSINAHLTTKGYEFLEENTSMKKAYKIAKEIKDWIPVF